MKLKKNFEKYILYIKWIVRYARPHTFSIILILLTEVFSALSGVAIAIVSKNLIDSATKGRTSSVFLFIVIFAALALAGQILGATASYISTRAHEAFSNSLRHKLFSTISSAEWMLVSKYHSGDILTRLTSDISAVGSGVINTFPSIINLGVQLTAAFCTLLYYEPYLAVLAFILGPFTVGFSRLWGRKLNKLQVKVQESESAYRSFIQEVLQNLLIVKTFRMEKQSSETLARLHTDRMGWVVKRCRTTVAASAILGLGYWAGYLLAFSWGAVRLSMGAITFGTLTAFLQLVGQVQTPFIGLSRTLPQIISATASTGRLMELEALAVEHGSEKLNVPARAGIRYQRVSFSYPQSQAVLDKISFNIRPGELVAVMGPSGVGKTTLIRILLALVKPSSGYASLIDSDETEYLASVETRDWMSYVPQGNTLFSGTVAENMLCGNSSASLDDLVEAARIADALDFIEELKEGFYTVIGEKGVGLSEGQAQRIAIARAILRKTPILLLDEATSALDMYTEMRVLKGIQEMQPSRTCIVITHRPSAIKICSRILKLNSGRLTEVSIDNMEDISTVSA